MEINGTTPKEISYIQTLLNHFSQSWTRRLKSRIFNGNELFSKSDLAKILSHENDDYAYQFLDKLEDEGVLTQPDGDDGVRKNASKTVPVYKFHRDKLIQAFSDTDYYQENRELLVTTLKKAENKEIL